MLLVVLTAHEAENERLLARVAWLEDEVDKLRGRMRVPAGVGGAEAQSVEAGE